MEPVIEPTGGHRRRLDAWLTFHQHLAAVLDAMGDGHFLILERKNTNRYIQFAAQGVDGMCAEVVSNRFLEPHQRLSIDDLATLRSMGWADPGESPNHSREWDQPLDPERMACVAVRTLVEALGVGHPDLLAYVAFEAAGTRILLPGLGLKAGDRA